MPDVRVAWHPIQTISNGWSRNVFTLSPLEGLIVSLRSGHCDSAAEKTFSPLQLFAQLQMRGRFRHTDHTAASTARLLG